VRPYCIANISWHNRSACITWPWSRSSYLPARRSDFREITKVSVLRDLWPWPWPWAHPGCRPVWGPSCVQVWSRSSYLPARRSNFREITKVSVSRDLWPWPWPWAHPGCRPVWGPSCASLVAIQLFACKKKRFSWNYKAIFVKLQKFGGDPATSVVEVAICAKFTDGRTDRQTDRQTDDGRCAIALAHGMS